MPKVILAEPDNRYNIQEALFFGTVHYLSPKSVSGLNLDQIVNAIENGLKTLEYDPTKDYICMTGHNLTIAVMLAVITKQHSVVKLLVFDARNSMYRERLITIGDNDETTA